MKREELKSKIGKLWESTRKDLEKVLKDTNNLVKKGEEYIKEVSGKGKEKLEAMRLTLKREKLYHELGKTVSSLPKSRWANSKKIEKLVEDIKKINKEIKAKT